LTSCPVLASMAGEVEVVILRPEVV
jgi:hypothetical protein